MILGGIGRDGRVLDQIDVDVVSGLEQNNQGGRIRGGSCICPARAKEVESPMTKGSI
jgi:hypothetical protein